MTDTPDTPWLRATDKRRSLQSEEAAAKLSGGRRVPMSGGGRQKGDVVTATWLIEDKVTDASSYRLEVGTLMKTCVEALQTGRLPMWRVTLPGFKLRILREEDYLYLQAMADKAHDA